MVKGIGLRTEQMIYQIDSLVKDFSNSTANNNTIELLQACMIFYQII